MSDFQVIENALKTTSARHRLQRAWAGFWKGLLAAGLLWLVVFAIYKLAPIPPVSLTITALAAACLLLAIVINSVLRRQSLLETARWIDERQKLQQRLSTAWEVAA